MAKEDINCRCFYVVDSASNAGGRVEISDFNSSDVDDIMGSVGEDMNVLPRHNEAIIPLEKFTEYALDPDREPNKAEAFELALGYNKDNANRLIANIRHNLTDYPAIPKGDRGFGMTYEVVMNLTGPSGGTAKVKTGWIDDVANGEMRLVTAFVDK